ncbi:MAG: hypothetical protein ACI80F_002325 [Natronomonas sp.]|jgi:hypothetical protein|uniref:hypothetical protein n=1 Tax=Natronomonas sp. TaxID=2184060 RepID=UPI003989EEDC
MPECEYCGAAHNSEEAHLKHLKSEHADELGPIDKRRVGGTDPDDGLPTGPIALGVVLLVSAAIVGYVVFIAGGSADNIGGAGSAHYHGTMEMTVTGDQIDFSQDKYQVQDRRFHFESRDGTEWHAHATGVTFEYAMESLGFDVSLSPKSITVEGTTYTDGEGHNVVFEISGDSVTDLSYVLQEGDHIRVVVTEA